jgi:hypothetical protein
MYGPTFGSHYSTLLNNLHETTSDFDPQELVVSYQELIIDVLYETHKAPSKHCKARNKFKLLIWVNKCP